MGKQDQQPGSEKTYKTQQDQQPGLEKTHNALGFLGCCMSHAESAEC